MEPKDWGGLMEIMYTDYERKDIPEKIVELKNRLDLLSTYSNFMKVLKTFTEEERNYLNSPVLDALYKTYNEIDDYEPDKMPFTALKFALKSELTLNLKLKHGTRYNGGYTTALMFRIPEDDIIVVSIETQPLKLEQKFLPSDAFDENGKVLEKYLYLLDHRYESTGFVTPRKIAEAKVVTKN
jgi:hypothetical protein